MKKKLLIVVMVFMLLLAITACTPKPGEAPTLVIEAQTATTITVAKVTNGEYSKDDGVTWQDGNVFTDLTTGSTYKVTIRFKADGKTPASKQATAKEVTLVKDNQAALTVTSSASHTFGTSYTIAATGGSGTGALTYEVVSGGMGEGTLSGAVLTITKVGTIKLKVTKAADANYNAVSVDFILTVAKGAPAYNAPSGLTTSYGNTLQDVTLPAGWAWVAPLTTSVGDAGERDFDAVFTPADTVNYNTATVTLTVMVEKAAQGALTVTSPATHAFGTTYTVTTTGGAGTGEVSCEIVTADSTGTGSFTGLVLTITKIGTIKIRVTKAADANYSLQTVDFTLTVTKGNQAALTITSSATHTFGTEYTITSTGGTTAKPVTYALVSGGTGEGAVTGDKLAITKAGTFKLTAAMEGDDNYNDVTSAEFTLTVNKANQAALTIDSPATHEFGEDYTITSTGGTTEGDITYSIVDIGTTGQGTIAGDKLAITKAGTFKLIATMAGDDNYNDVTSAEFTLTVAKADQEELTLTSPITHTFGTTYTVTTTGGSGEGAVSYEIIEADSTGVATFEGAVLTITKAGDIKIRITKAADDNYAAETLEFTLTVNRANQAALTIGSAASHMFGTDYTITSSGGTTEGTVTYAIVAAGTTGVGTITDDQLAITKAGTFKLTATMAGDDNYNDVTSDIFTLLVSRADQETLTVTSLATHTFGTEYAVVFSGGSGTGAVSYEIVTGDSTGAGTFAAAVLTITRAGTIKIRITKAADDNYIAETVDFTLTVNKAAVTVAAPTCDTEDLIAGKPLPVLTGTTTGGTYSWDAKHNNVLLAGENDYTWIFTLTDTVNYEIATGTGTGEITLEAIKVQLVKVINNVDEDIDFEFYDENGIPVTTTDGIYVEVGKTVRVVATIKDSDDEGIYRFTVIEGTLGAKNFAWFDNDRATATNGKWTLNHQINDWGNYTIIIDKVNVYELEIQNAGGAGVLVAGTIIKTIYDGIFSTGDTIWDYSKVLVRANEAAIIYVNGVDVFRGTGEYWFTPTSEDDKVIIRIVKAVLITFENRVEGLDVEFYDEDTQEKIEGGTFYLEANRNIEIRVTFEATDTNTYRLTRIYKGSEMNVNWFNINNLIDGDDDTAIFSFGTNASGIHLYVDVINYYDIEIENSTNATVTDGFDPIDFSEKVWDYRKIYIETTTPIVVYFGDEVVYRGNEGYSFVPNKNMTIRIVKAVLITFENKVADLDVRFYDEDTSEEIEGGTFYLEANRNIEIRVTFEATDTNTYRLTQIYKGAEMNVNWFDKDHLADGSGNTAIVSFGTNANGIHLYVDVVNYYDIEVENNTDAAITDGFDSIDFSEKVWDYRKIYIETATPIIVYFDGVEVYRGEEGYSFVPGKDMTIKVVNAHWVTVDNRVEGDIEFEFRNENGQLVTTDGIYVEEFKRIEVVATLKNPADTGIYRFTVIDNSGTTNFNWFDKDKAAEGKFALSQAINDWGNVTIIIDRVNVYALAIDNDAGLDVSVLAQFKTPWELARNDGDSVWDYSKLYIIANEAVVVYVNGEEVYRGADRYEFIPASDNDEVIIRVVKAYLFKVENKAGLDVEFYDADKDEKIEGNSFYVEQNTNIELRSGTTAVVVYIDGVEVYRGVDGYDFAADKDMTIKVVIAHLVTVVNNVDGYVTYEFYDENGDLVETEGGIYVEEGKSVRVVAKIEYPDDEAIYRFTVTEGTLGAKNFAWFDYARTTDGTWELNHAINNWGDYTIVIDRVNVFTLQILNDAEVEGILIFAQMLYRQSWEGVLETGNKIWDYSKVLIKVDEAVIGTVTISVNGEEITLDEDGNYWFIPTDAEGMVIITIVEIED